ncbi:MAG: 8-oxo-dGTP diphosphatase [Gaiellaceae bacterium]|nr:8-oxo-dGTP diphosphatase [Gaiellaceae bacterium]
MSEVVRAAGGVPWRRNGDDLEVLLVHRPRYGDWSFPKGKNDPGESDEAAAIREVEEETGLGVELGPELASTSYNDSKGRPKRVRYWALEAQEADARPQNEVDAVEWLSPDDAAVRLSYDRDRAVLRSLLDSIL